MSHKIKIDNNWVTLPYIFEAPIDGFKYLRKDGNWFKTTIDEDTMNNSYSPTGHTHSKLVDSGGTQVLYIDNQGKVRIDGDIVQLGHITGTTFVKSGGTAGQFLMANGTTVTNSFSNYLPLSGGELSGDLKISFPDALKLLYGGSLTPVTESGFTLNSLSFGDSYQNIQSKIKVERGSGGGSSNLGYFPTDMSFWVTPNNSNTPIERMRIFESGNVAIGTNNITPYKLNVSGDTNINGTLNTNNLTTSELNVSGTTNIIGTLNTTSTFTVKNGNKTYFKVNALSSTSVFIGDGAGATGVTQSNFIGTDSGYGAYGAYDSNFIGRYTGYESIFSHNCNFIGRSAGYNSNNTILSNFFGTYTGSYSSYSSYSNFIGYNTGFKQYGVTYSTLIGTKVGDNTNNDNQLGINNIIIGTNISLPSGSTNMMNFGGVLFGTNTYDITVGSPSIIPNTSGKIGIGTSDPQTTLEVVGDTTINGNLILNNEITDLIINHASDGTGHIILNDGVDTLKITSFGGESINIVSPYEINISTPLLSIPNTHVSNGNSAATKQYVDDNASGLINLEPVFAATTGNIPEIGGSPYGTSSIDDIDANGKRVLVKNQVNKKMNGIWICNSGTNWIRTTDMNEDSEVKIGMHVLVTSGNTNAGNGYTLTFTGTTATLGTTDLTWNQFSQAGVYSAGNGLSKIGNTFLITPTGVTETMLSSINTPNKIVYRDNSGNFSAGVITATLSGSSSSSSNLSLINLGNGSMNQRFLTGVYRTESGSTGTLPYAPVLHVNGDDVGWQLQAQYGTGSDILQFRGEQNTYGFSPWRNIWHSANFNPDSKLNVRSFGTASEYNVTDFTFVKSSIDFGGNSGTTTTSEFITLLTTYGAFAKQHWVTKNTWNYSGNKIIRDTLCGDIELAGSVIEVFSYDVTVYTIRITTSPTVNGGGVPKSEFIYTNHGSGYLPGWRKQFNTENDGIGSGLDADLLDGSHGSDYQKKLVERNIINNQSTYTLLSTDNGKYVDIYNTTDVQVYITDGIFPIGTQIILRQHGTGQLNFIHTNGASYIKSAGSKLKTKEIYSVCQLVLLSNTPEDWSLFGDLVL